MSRLECLLLTFIVVFANRVVRGRSDNVTVPVDTLVNLTNHNELWTMMLKECEEPSLVCVQNNVFRYLKKTLDETNDLQFTSFLKFTKNHLNYNKTSRSSDGDQEEFWHQDEFPIESMSRSLQDETRKFLMTHDVELSLPETFLPNSFLRIAPKGFENNGALVNLEVVSQDLEESRGVEQGRLFKKLAKFINEKIIYAVLAILLVIKLLAVKFLFILPLIVGAATAKKLLLKILLFVFPFLHHVFKFCAYYPIQAKFHHHKHLISHIHQIAPHKHHEHHEEFEVGPPGYEHHGEHYAEFDDDVSVLPDDGGFGHGLISHRKDPIHENEISSLYGGVAASRRKPHRPLTSKEIERTLAKAEKEAIIKARLEKERLRIRDENLKLQEELNQALKLQEKLKHQANYLKKVPHTKISASIPYNRHGIGPPLRTNPSSFDPVPGPVGQQGPGLDLPAGYIPQHTVPQRPPQQFNPQPVSQNHFENSYQQPSNKVHQQNVEGPVYRPDSEPISSNKVTQTDSAQKPVDPRVSVFDNSGEVKNVGNGLKYSAQITGQSGEKTIVEQQAIYEAASITYDPFYSPMLKKIDNILQSLGFVEEPCKERLICSMYKSPTKYSPHSNLVSAELSRDSSELAKPTSTNSAVIRFYKYVQAARDGQDQRDCLRLYPACQINTEIS
ncbi:uncharacterized protein LOC126742412 [Anthonomus grandis grandis]|uniref:uncharacterized protein LOC126742412 n=1 Tax=Anthonomus grandis grandis TaxID=2921223 RepID=UPI0021657F19|nr:uncharacterized protein LOC126742412 [Anthonomus grandis grandis]